MLRGNVPFLGYIANGPPSAVPIGSKIASRGSVGLNASDPEGEVVVDLRPLTNPIDYDLMVAFVRFFRTHYTRDFAEWNATVVRPGANVTTDEQIADLVRQEYNPIAGHHFVGTAAKMPKHLGGVVNEELVVHGLKGLRVADASIIPVLTSAATQFTVYSVGEQAAQLVKRTWSER
jgi:choline dehydrogenase